MRATARASWHQHRKGFRILTRIQLGCQDFTDSGQASFQRRWIPEGVSNGISRCIPMALRLRPTQRQKAHVLSCLQEALEHWRTTFQCSKITKGIEFTVSMGLGLEYQSAHQTETWTRQSMESSRSQRECTKTQGRGQGQRKQRRCKRAERAVRPECCLSSLGHTRDCNQFSAGTYSSCAVSISSGGCGTSSCSAQILSGHHLCTGSHQEGSGQGRQSDFQSPLQRPQSRLQPSWESSPTVCFSERSPERPSAELVEAFEGLGQQLAKATAAVQRPTERIWGSTPPSTARAHHSTKTSPAAQQTGSRSGRAAEVGAPVSADAGDVGRDSADGDNGAAFEAEATALVLQVQESLQQSIAAAAEDSETMEINSDEEADRKHKRPRSMEPFGVPTAPLGDGHVSSPPS